MCRTEGQQYLKTFGVISDKTWNTLDEWKSAFYYVLPQSINCDPNKIPESNFGLIYKQLIIKAQTYLKEKKLEKIKNKKIRIQNEKRKRRETDRKNAICKLCKTQCTSTIQLKKHMNGTRCIKLQKKLLKI